MSTNVNTHVLLALLTAVQNDIAGTQTTGMHSYAPKRISVGAPTAVGSYGADTFPVPGRRNLPGYLLYV